MRRYGHDSAEVRYLRLVRDDVPIGEALVACGAELAAMAVRTTGYQVLTMSGDTHRTLPESLNMAARVRFPTPAAAATRTARKAAQKPRKAAPSTASQHHPAAHGKAQSRGQR